MTKFLQTLPGPISKPARVVDRSRNPLWRLRRLFFGLFLFGVLGVVSLLAYFISTDLPEEGETGAASFVCFSNDEVCDRDTALKVISSANNDRDIVQSFAEIPDVVVEAMVATEDQKFYSHNGFDAGGLARAVFQTGRSQLGLGGAVQGGSTITQQYVKNAFFDASTFKADASGLARKPKEAVWAVKLERRIAKDVESGAVPCKAGESTKKCVKDEVMLRYLNRIFFGRGTSGVKAAARTYFGKDLNELQLEEAAYLAGVLRNPSRAEPENHPEEASRRILVTFKLMRDVGAITEAEEAEAIARMGEDKLPDFVPKTSKEGLGELKYNGENFDAGTEYFVQEVVDQLDDLSSQTGRNINGLRVFTTLDPEIQKAAYESVTSFVEPGNEAFPSAALVSVDKDGLIRAMVGGTDFDTSQYNFAMAGHRAAGGMQPGSLMKPIALAAFLDDGKSANSRFTAPKTIEFPKTYEGITLGDDSWNPKGGRYSDDQYPNHTTLADATVNSLNTVYAQLAYKVGPENIASTANEMGVTTELSSTNPSVVLGTSPTSVLDMASAYSTFARMGLQVDPVLIERIEDSDGNVVCWYPSNGVCESEGSERPARVDSRVLQTSHVEQMNQILSDTVSRGTGTKARTGNPVAGKTGTSQDNRDAWFTGYTCDGFTTSVWLGYDDERRMVSSASPSMVQLFGSSFTGGNGNVDGGDVAAIWGSYMKQIPVGQGCSMQTSSNFSGEVVNDKLVSALPACIVSTAVAPNPDTDPVDPEDPDNPVDPEDPDNPVDPEDPDNPVDPDNPIDPDNPVIPIDPDNPVRPVLPSRPGDPIVPAGGNVDPQLGVVQNVGLYKGGASMTLAIGQQTNNQGNNQNSNQNNNQSGNQGQNEAPVVEPGTQEPQTTNCLVPSTLVDKSWVPFGSEFAKAGIDPRGPVVIEPGSPTPTVPEEPVDSQPTVTFEPGLPTLTLPPTTEPGTPTTEPEKGTTTTLPDDTEPTESTEPIKQPTPGRPR